MDAFLALLSGILIALMVAANGGLSERYGVFWAAVVIHAVGAAFAYALCRLKKEDRPAKRLPVWLYLGGVIGVMTTVFDNFAFGRISVTAIVALGLVGQSAASLVLDGFGLFGQQKRPLSRYAAPGLVCAGAGIALMLRGQDASSAAAVALAAAAGVTVVLSRTVNARLSGNVGAMRASFVNHLTGLPVTLLLAAAVSSAPALAGSGPVRPWIYAGGLLGVAVVYLCNLAVPRVPALRFSLLSAAGQLLAGAALDALPGGQFSGASFRAGLLIAGGLLASRWLEARAARRAEAARAYWDRIREAEYRHRRDVYGSAGSGGYDSSSTRRSISARKAPLTEETCSF